MRLEEQRGTLMRMTGSMEQLAFVRQMREETTGMRIIEVENGRLRFTVLPDRGLDIASLRLDGTNVTFLAKAGLSHRTQEDILGGLFFTCGPDNVGPAEPARGLPMHGSFRTATACHLGVDACWENDRYVLRIRGELRYASLFGSNIVLRRVIETAYGETVLTIRDELTNEGFAPHPLMLLYHINAGYPLLDAGTQVDIPPSTVYERDTGDVAPDIAWNTMPAPTDHAPEKVFYHEGMTGKIEMRVRHPSGSPVLTVRYHADELPVLTQWISPASGAYAMGMEPGICHVQGLSEELARGTVQMLEAGERKCICLTIRAEP